MSKSNRGIPIKLISIIIILALSFSLAACKNEMPRVEIPTGNTTGAVTNDNDIPESENTGTNRTDQNDSPSAPRGNPLNMPQVPPKDITPGSWAIYWYLCGTDLETRGACATQDLIEMIEVTLPDNVTVVIETGGTETWRNDAISADYRQRFVYTGNYMGLAESSPLSNMADAQTLADFLYFCNDNYPAEKQMLILWDHGGGSVVGLEVDELYGRDIMTLPAFRDAINSVPAVSGAYEVVGFDACLMGSVEMVDVLYGNANYMVASEESEPGIGWDYTGLFSALERNPTISGDQLGREICDTFYSTCAMYEIEQENTLSVIDLNRAGALLSAYRAMGDEMLLKAVNEKESYISDFARAARDSLMFASEYYSMVDMGDLVGQAMHLLPQSGRALLDALDSCVVYRIAGEYRSQSTGLSCYYNFTGDMWSTECFMDIGANMSYAYYHEYASQGALSEEAQIYIQELAQQAEEPVETPTILPSTGEMGLDNFPVYVGASGRWEMDLGPQRASSLAAVFVKLMWISMSIDDASEGEAFRIMYGTNRDLIADYENGVFIENFVDTWGSIDGLNVYMEPISFEPGKVLYAVPILLNSEEYTLHVAYTYDSYGQGQYEILGAWEADNEDTESVTRSRIPSKNFRRLEPGDEVTALHYPMLKDEYGIWYIDEPPMPIASIIVNEDTSFYSRSTGDGYYALLFEMIDYSGNHYYSDTCSFLVREGRISRLPNGIVPATATQPPNTIKGYYLTRETWHHEAWHQDIEYFAVAVDIDVYVAMAEALGNPYGNYGDQTEGRGYTIQLYSDVVDLDKYAGMNLVYLAGEYSAGDSIFHRRDIIFRVTEIYEVW